MADLGVVFGSLEPPLLTLTTQLFRPAILILRAASVHYPVLRRLLGALYKTTDSHNQVCDIDKALSSGDYRYLMSVIKSSDFESILRNDVDVPCSKDMDGNSPAKSVLRVPEELLLD